MSTALIVIGVVALVLVWVAAIFNRLVALRNRVQNGWAEIDVQLKRRHDLVPNLVETVRGYMEHERSVLETVTQARSSAVAAGNNILERSVAESALTAALTGLFARVENYPQLQAVESTQLLQEQLTSIENRIAFARQFYNDEVMKYNTAQATFPRNLFAGMLGFSPTSMFTATEGDRAVAQVKLSA